MNLGRFHLQEPLRKRATGTIFRAEDSLLARPVALWLFDDASNRSEEIRERVSVAARAGARLEHPAIAALYESGEIDGRPYIATQLVDGEPLTTRLERGPLPIASVYGLALDAAQALAHAHERGVLHSGLTSESIVLRADGRFVLVDVTLARIDDPPMAASILPREDDRRRLAPELFTGSNADERSDQWSLGVVLYRAVTGSWPFVTGDGKSWFDRMLREPPTRPSELRDDVPADLERVILRLLEKAPANRYPSAHALAEELLRLAPGLAASERQESMAGSSAQDSRRGSVLEIRRWWRRVTRRRLGWGSVLAAFVLTALLIPGTKWLLDRFAPFQSPTLAVLPMRIEGPDSARAGVVAEALGEDLVGRFRAAGGLRILPWTTTGRPISRDSSLTGLARQVHADYLLTGLVVGEAEDVRVRTRLIDGSSGRTRWSHEFTAPGTDFGALQSTIVMAACSGLSRPLDASARRRLAADAPRNPEAYEYYVMGANAWHSGDPERMRMTQPFFQRAIELDSTLAGAWVGLGAVTVDAYFRGSNAGDSDLAEAERCFHRALALEPGSSTAARGLIQCISERAGPSSSTQIDDIAASALMRDSNDPGALLTAGIGFTLGAMVELGVPALCKAQKLDPGDQATAWYLVLALAWSGHPQRCLAAGADYLTRFGDDLEVYTWMTGSAQRLGRTQEARALGEQGLALASDSPAHYIYRIVARMDLAAGDRRAFDELVARLIPTLEVRLAAAPDNLRLLDQLREFYVMTGDDRRVARLDSTAGGARSNASSSWERMARLGHVDRARAILATARTDDDMEWNSRVDSIGVPPAQLDTHVIAVMHSPEYARWREAVDRRQLVAYERYRRIVARYFPRNPDVPGPRDRWPRIIPPIPTSLAPATGRGH